MSGSLAPASGAVPFSVPSLPDAAAIARAHRLARRLLGCEHVADDAVQEALIACWQLPRTLERPGAWLLRAVRLRCRQVRRAASRRTRHEHGAACELHRGCDNPLHHAVAHELHAQLDEALAGLPDEQRAAYELYVATGLDYLGVAAALQLPLGTVRSRLHRARQALRACVAPTAGRSADSGNSAAASGTREVCS